MLYVFLPLLLVQFTLAAVSDSLVRILRSRDTVSISYSLLDDAAGHTPCDMEQMIKGGCPDDRRATITSREDSEDPTWPTPSPNSCTCNNLFFNLWSACLMSRGNASWVTSSATWQDRCQEKDVQFNDSMQYSTTSSIPPWAYQSMPKNGSFDILAAVRLAESANPESSNSRLQVVIPVVVGVAVAFVCCTVFWLYRRRFLTMASNSSPKAVAPYNASHFHISVLPRTRKVHETSRDDLWVIDRDERLHSESFQLIPTPRSGHVRLQSSSPEALLLDLDAKPIRTNTDRLYTTISSFFTFWKPKPVRVKSRLPGPRFDIDAENADLKGRSLLKKPRRQKHSSAKPTSRRPDEDNDSEDEEYRQLPGAEDVDPLIPRSSPLPSVLLISRRGTNFTLSSIDTASAQIQVVPPSPETPPPRPRPVPRQRHRSHPRTPPAPNYPAPLPPGSQNSSVRTTPRSSPNSSPRPYLSSSNNNLSFNTPDSSHQLLSSSSPNEPIRPLPSTPPADIPSPLHSRETSNESSASLASGRSRRLPRPPTSLQPQTLTRNVSTQSLTSRHRPLPPRPTLEDIHNPAPPYNPKPTGHESVLASSPIARHSRLVSSDDLFCPPVPPHMLSEPSETIASLLFAPAAGYLSSEHQLLASSSESLAILN